MNNITINCLMMPLALFMLTIGYCLFQDAVASYPYVIVEGTDFSVILLSDHFPVKCCAIYSFAVTVNIFYFNVGNARTSVKITDNRSNSF